MPGKQQAVIDILMSVGIITRVKPGCIYCGIYEEHNHGQNIIYIEKWETKEDMHKHVQSNLYLRILNAIELAAEPPEVCFHEDSGSSGIELIGFLRTTKDEATDPECRQ